MLCYLTIGFALWLTAAGVLGGELYKVKVASESDARLLRSTGAEGLVVLSDGYLVLTDSISRRQLENSSLNYRLLATNLKREEIAFDDDLVPAHIPPVSPLYEDGELRICRYPIEPLKDQASPPGFRPMNAGSVEIRYLKSEYRAGELLQRLQPLGVSLDSLIAGVSRDSLYAYTAQLQSYGPRHAGSTADSLSGIWLESKFHSIGYDSVVADSFTGYYDGYVPCCNIIAYKVGSRFPNHHIVVGAHCDSYGEAPGADDNASGCAGVLELARILKDIETDLTIVFALFDSEESGMWGSYHYAAEASAGDESIMYMLNLDMIGFQDNVDSVNVHHGTQTELSLLWIHLADSLVGIKGVMSGQRASDQLPFAQLGIETSFIIERVFNTYYHTARDSTTHLNFPYMTQLVKASLAAIYTVSVTVRPEPTLAFSFPLGVPRWFPPGDSDKFEVKIEPAYGGAIVAGTPTLFYAYGDDAYTDLPLTPFGTDQYRAFFPGGTCAQRCSYYAAAQESTSGWKYSSDPDTPHHATVATDSSTIFRDDFETDKGWTVVSLSYRAIEGSWERGVPVGSGDWDDPPADYDGSGNCYLTGNVPGKSGVDGYTYLISPVLDVAGPDALVCCAVWFSDHRGNYYHHDHTMSVNLSNDSGVTWTTVQTIHAEPTVFGGWRKYEFLARDFLPTTDKMRLQFAVINNHPEAMYEYLEASVDAVSVINLSCDMSNCCRGNTGNVNMTGIVDLSDLSALISYLTGGGYTLPCVSEANVNGTGIVDLSDLSALVSYLTDGGYVLPPCA